MLPEITIAIIEDNTELREGLATLLGTDPRYSCIGAFGDCESFLRSLDDDVPDVVLMDIGLPGINGVECLRRIQERRLRMHIIMLTIFEDEEKIFQSLCSGAAGYLLKESHPETILRAIEEIVAGGAPMSPRIARRVLNMFAHAVAPRETSIDLSERERAVLEKLVKGLSYKMIAEELFISVHTVNSHLKNIYEKLHVHSKSEAVAKALKDRIV